MADRPPMPESPAEFLARMIDRDEAVAREWLEDDAAADQSRFGATRMLAECTAKREIVEVLLPGSTNPRDYQGFPGIVVRALLRPYAGEPGFNPTWLED